MRKHKMNHTFQEEWIYLKRPGRELGSDKGAVKSVVQDIELKTIHFEFEQDSNARKPILPIIEYVP